VEAIEIRMKIRKHRHSLSLRLGSFSPAGRRSVS
jgi:hypothetical protein